MANDVRTHLIGLLLTPRVHRDSRGYFTRTFEESAISGCGLETAGFVQDSQSRSFRGVIRGMHLRRGAGEAKLVRVARGRIHDVLLDARPQSPTFGTVERHLLDDEEHRSLFIPRGVAHGWQALSEVADVCYRIDAEHDSSQDVTIRFDDPDIAAGWPLPVGGLSDRDASALSWREVAATLGGPPSSS